MLNVVGMWDMTNTNMTNTKTITVTLNGAIIKYESKPLNLTSLLDQRGFTDKKIAVAINGQFVPRSSYDKHIISENDEIEIVAPMQGG